MKLTPQTKLGKISFKIDEMWNRLLEKYKVKIKKSNYPQNKKYIIVSALLRRTSGFTGLFVTEDRCLFYHHVRMFPSFTSVNVMYIHQLQNVHVSFSKWTSVFIIYNHLHRATAIYFVSYAPLKERFKANAKIAFIGHIASLSNFILILERFRTYFWTVGSISEDQEM